MHDLMQAEDMREWCERWHIAEPWVETAARELKGLEEQRAQMPGGHPADRYLSTEDRAKYHPLFSFPGDTDMSDLRLPDVDPPIYDPLTQTKREYLRAVKKYIGLRETAARAIGFCPPRGRTIEHFRWLVHYQVLGKSYSQIAVVLPAASRADAASTVRKAVTRLAEYLCLPLRPA